MIIDMKKLVGFALVSAVVLLSACSSTPEDEGKDSAGTMDSSSVSSQVDGSDVDEYGNPLVRVYYFDFDKATLNADVRSALDAQAARLRKNSVNIRLEGHADERGTREYNLALGERRAKAVANYLVIQGVESSRIQTISYGEEKPVAFGNDEAAWAKNRFVELVDIK